MTEIQGTATNTRSAQEGGEVVLRFVLEYTDQSGRSARLPVEMRGRKVLGVLHDGDKVLIRMGGKGFRDRDGVARPARITNLSTQSVVHVARRGCLATAFSFVFSVAMSIVTGLISTVIINALLGFTPAEPIAYSLEEGPPPEAVAQEPLLLIPLAVGLIVAAVVFFLIFVRPRLRRA